MRRPIDLGKTLKNSETSTEINETVYRKWSKKKKQKVAHRFLQAQRPEEMLKVSEGKSEGGKTKLVLLRKVAKIAVNLIKNTSTDFQFEVAESESGAQ